MHRRERARCRGELELVNTRLLAAQQELKATLYATRTNLALAAYTANSAGRAQTLLNLLRPASGEPDRRGFEWYLLHALTHQTRFVLEGHNEVGASDPAPISVQRVAYSPDGRRLASGNWDGTILIWDPDSGRIKRTIKAHTQRVNGLAFRNDGRHLASVGLERTIKLWDAYSGDLIRTIQRPPAWSTR